MKGRCLPANGGGPVRHNGPVVLPPPSLWAGDGTRDNNPGAARIPAHRCALSQDQVAGSAAETHYRGRGVADRAVIIGHAAPVAPWQRVHVPVDQLELLQCRLVRSCNER